MATIEQTGTYVDAEGNPWFFRAGDRAPDGLRLQEGADVKAGAPENRAGAPEETREKAPYKPAEPRIRGKQ